MSQDSDYETLFAMWVEPQTNMTAWRRYIEAMLKDDIRYKTFRRETKAGKTMSTLRRTFYLRMKLENIGLKSKSPETNLAKLEECLAVESDCPPIQESVALALITALCKSGVKNAVDKPEFERSRKLLSLAAYNNYKPAIRQLGAVAFFKAQPSPGIFAESGPNSVKEDPFYALGYAFQLVAQNPHHYATMVDAIINLNMPLNTFSFMLTCHLCRLYAKFEYIKLVEEAWKSHFIRLCEYVKDHITQARVYPKKRDPFSSYFDEQSDEQKDDMETYIALYVGLTTDNVTAQSE